MSFNNANFFVALFVLSLCPFGISVGVGAFVIGLSQISSFFSSFKCYNIHDENSWNHYIPRVTGKWKDLRYNQRRV